jgi:hypothetical protein
VPDALNTSSGFLVFGIIAMGDLNLIKSLFGYKKVIVVIEPRLGVFAPL